MYMQWSHHFCNTHIPADGPRSERKITCVTLPVGYYKINSATGKDMQLYAD